MNYKTNKSYKNNLLTYIGTLIIRMILKIFGVPRVLSITKTLIDNQSFSNKTAKKHLREQIIEILGNQRDEKQIQDFCARKGIHASVGKTVYLYLNNSKDEVADILNVEGTTVIRRVKRFIEKATSN